MAGIALGMTGMHVVDAEPQPTSTPQFHHDGTVRVPTFNLPPSSLLSAPALMQQEMRAAVPVDEYLGGSAVGAMRARSEETLAPRLVEMRARYRVNIVEQRIGGVRTRIITPADGETDPSRVLINLHGGGFMQCAEACAMLESIPMAAVGHFRVVTVDYRMAPEYVFPAASEDVAAVYQALLAQYRPSNIGMYGCSAGGLLGAETVALLAERKMPVPGALGIFGAGAIPGGVGDSATVAAYIDGSMTSPHPGGPLLNAYFRDISRDDPRVAPVRSLAIAAKFPPTLLISGTRARDLSPALYTNNQLLKAGVDSRLIVGEGMGHCYIYQSDLPEARDAYDQIVRFFEEKLGGGKGPVAKARPL